jgi:hypothetical protein
MSQVQILVPHPNFKEYTVAKKIQITSLDFEGNVAESEIIDSDWCLSQLEYHFDRMKKQLYRGEIEHIVIDNIE